MVSLPLFPPACRRNGSRATVRTLFSSRSDIRGVRTDRTRGPLAFPRPTGRRGVIPGRPLPAGWYINRL